MKKKLIKLNKNRAHLARADREKWFAKYSITKVDVVTGIRYFDHIAEGAPFIININGTYYYLDKLFKVVTDKMSYNNLIEYSKTVHTAIPNVRYYFRFD